MWKTILYLLLIFHVKFLYLDYQNVNFMRQEVEIVEESMENLKNNGPRMLNVRKSDMIEMFAVEMEKLEEKIFPSTIVPLSEYSLSREKDYILYVIGVCSGNKSKAAELLEIDRKTLYNKLNSK